MHTIDISSEQLMGIGRMTSTGPKDLTCKCKRVVAGLLENNKEDSFIYGVSIPHYRIVCGIHERVAYIPHEEVICFCENCAEQIISEIPRIFSAQHTPQPTRGGHFITASKLGLTGQTEKFSRFQCHLEKFRRIMDILK